MSPLQIVVSQTPLDYGDTLGSRSKDSAGTPTTAEVLDHNEEDLGIDLRRSDSMPQAAAAAASATASTSSLPNLETAPASLHVQERSLSTSDAGRVAAKEQRQKSPPSSSPAAAPAATSSPPSEDASDVEIPRKLDKFGFIVNVNAQGHVYDAALDDQSEQFADVPSFADAKRTQSREKKWKQTINSWERRRHKVVIRRLRKGVPDSIRGQVWAKLGGGIRKKGLYDEIIRKTANVVLETSGSTISSTNPSPVSATSSSSSPSAASSSSSAAAKAKSKSSKKKQKKAGAKSTPATAVAAAKEEDDPYVHTKGFRDIQNTIERDIHRTYPRHNLFYEDDASVELRNSPSNLSTATPDNPLLHGLCDPQLTALISNMDNNMQISPSEGLDLSTQASSVIPQCPAGQASLRRVLRAYSYYDREVGYCQGMNFIAGMFLTLMSEEESFWLLVSVMKEKPCSMRGLFGEGMRETHKVLHVAEKLIQQFLPRISKHFDHEHIHVTMYATQWLLTQFTSSFKFDLVTRVWDCFLGEGWKIIYRVMLALLQQYQTQLLKMSFEEILAFFRELPTRVNGPNMIQVALKIPLRKKHIEKYEMEWDAK